MDFISGLPPSKRGNCILVVVDKFSKYAHFLILNHPFTALTVAKVYLSEVYKLHGLPTAIISDRDPIFTSKLWRELFRLSRTKLCLSSSYHPSRMARLSGLTNVWRRTYVVLCSHAHVIGQAGYPLLNFGTILVTIRPWVNHHSRYFMATHHLSWELSRLDSVQFQICNNSYATGTVCCSKCACTYKELNRE